MDRTWLEGTPASERGEASLVFIRPKKQTSVASLFLRQKEYPRHLFPGAFSFRKVKRNTGVSGWLSVLLHLGQDLLPACPLNNGMGR